MSLLCGISLFAATAGRMTLLAFIPTMSTRLLGHLIRMPDGLAFVCGIISLAGIAARFTDRIPLRRYQTFPVTADEILASGQTQRFADQIMIARVAELHQRALHGLVLGAAGNKDGFHGAWIESGVKHAGRQRARGGVEVLHLIGLEADITQIAGQFNCGRQITSRMAEAES